jgi:hypothetical protein
MKVTEIIARQNIDQMIMEASAPPTPRSNAFFDWLNDATIKVGSKASNGATNTARKEFTPRSVELGTDKTGAVRNVPIKSVWSGPNPTAGAKILNSLPKGMMAYFRILKWLGFVDIALEFYQNKQQLEALLKDGSLKQADYNVGVRMLVEQTTAKILLSGAMARMLRYIIEGIFILRWTGRAIGVVGSVASLGLLGGPLVIEILATEAIAIMFQRWLNSEDGKTAMAYIVMYCIDDTLVWVWNLGFGYYFQNLKAMALSSEAKNDPKVQKALGIDPNSSVGGAGTAIGAITSAASASQNGELAKDSNILNTKNAIADKTDEKNGDGFFDKVWSAVKTGTSAAVNAYKGTSDKGSSSSTTTTPADKSKIDATSSNDKNIKADKMTNDSDYNDSSFKPAFSK